MYRAWPPARNREVSAWGARPVEVLELCGEVRSSRSGDEAGADLELALKAAYFLEQLSLVV